MPPAISTAPTFAILVVCSGNICRSPIAAQLLRSRLGQASGFFRIESAGTLTEPGYTMPKEAAEMSRRYGGVPDGHSSTPLTAASIMDADLVLTATREHRAAVVSMHPRAARFTFTLPEFARLAASIEPDELGSLREADALLKAIAGRRGFSPPEHPEEDDIEDPYLKPIEAYERVAAEIDRTIGPIVEALRVLEPNPAHRAEDSESPR